MNIKKKKERIHCAVSRLPKDLCARAHDLLADQSSSQSEWSSIYLISMVEWIEHDMTRVIRIHSHVIIISIYSNRIFVCLKKHVFFFFRLCVPWILRKLCIPILVVRICFYARIGTIWLIVQQKLFCAIFMFNAVLNTQSQSASHKMLNIYFTSCWINHCTAHIRYATHMVWHRLDYRCSSTMCACAMRACVLCVNVSCITVRFGFLLYSIIDCWKAANFIQMHTAAKRCVPYQSLPVVFNQPTTTTATTDHV